MWRWIHAYINDQELDWLFYFDEILEVNQEPWKLYYSTVLNLVCFEKIKNLTK